MNTKGIAMMVMWVFILIAGSLIILLFFVIANFQAGAGKERLSIEALDQIDSILATQATSADTFAVIPISNEKLSVVCSIIPDGTSTTGEPAILSQIEISGRPRSTEYELVVGRDVETNRLTLFSKKLELPFHIGNILFITSDTEQLIMDGPSSFDPVMQAIDQSLPPPVNRQIGRPTHIDAANAQSTRIVLFVDAGTINIPTPPQADNAPQNAQYMVVQADPASAARQGTITYFTYNNGFVRGDTLSYTGLEMLLGLIWQGDETRGACFEEKIRVQMETHAALQIARTNLLYASYDGIGNTNCAVQYGTIILQDLVTQTSQRNGGVIDFSGLPAAVDAVHSKNEALLRRDRCATIY